MTSDTGSTWMIADSSKGNSFYGYYVYNDKFQWKVGTSGRIYASFDASIYVNNEDVTDVQENVIISPNPVIDMLNIKSLKKLPVQDVTLYSMNGSVVLVVSSSESIDVSSLSPGVYIAEIRIDGIVHKKKFVKI